MVEAHGRPDASAERPPADRQCSGMLTHGHCPAFARQGQFLLGPLAFGKQAQRVRRRETAGRDRGAGRAAPMRARSRHRPGAPARRRCGRGGSSLRPRSPAPPRAETPLCANRPRPARPRARRGSPAPGPETRRRCRDRSGFARRSGISGRSCAESRMWRRHRSPSVSRPTRLIRADHRRQQLRIGFEPRQCFT